LVSQDVPIAVGQAGLAQLNERSREIFRQIVESYLATGEPVGSRNLSRIIPMTLSSASSMRRTPRPAACRRSSACVSSSTR
jgi:heat-inducible transcriptional repressor